MRLALGSLGETDHRRRALRPAGPAHDWRSASESDVAAKSAPTARGPTAPPPLPPPSLRWCTAHPHIVRAAGCFTNELSDASATLCSAGVARQARGRRLMVQVG